MPILPLSFPVPHTLFQSKTILLVNFTAFRSTFSFALAAPQPKFAISFKKFRESHHES